MLSNATEKPPISVGDADLYSEIIKNWDLLDDLGIG